MDVLLARNSVTAREKKIEKIRCLPYPRRLPKNLVLV